jgi:hypothetical protein
LAQSIADIQAAAQGHWAGSTLLQLTPIEFALLEALVAARGPPGGAQPTPPNA